MLYDVVPVLVPLVALTGNTCNIFTLTPLLSYNLVIVLVLAITRRGESLSLARMCLLALSERGIGDTTFIGFLHLTLAPPLFGKLCHDEANLYVQ